MSIWDEAQPRLPVLSRRGVSVSAEIERDDCSANQANPINEIVRIVFQVRTSIIEHQVGHLQLKAHFVILSRFTIQTEGVRPP